MTCRGRHDVYGWTKARTVPGKAQGGKNYGRLSATAPTVGRALRQPPTTFAPLGDQACYPWRTRCNSRWRKTFATKRRTIMADYIWELGIDWEAVQSGGVGYLRSGLTKKVNTPSESDLF